MACAGPCSGAPDLTTLDEPEVREAMRLPAPDPLRWWYGSSGRLGRTFPLAHLAQALEGAPIKENRDLRSRRGDFFLRVEGLGRDQWGLPDRSQVQAPLIAIPCAGETQRAMAFREDSRGAMKGVSTYPAIHHHNPAVTMTTEQETAAR